MPFINSKVSVSLDDKKRETLKTELGKAIEIFPGKSEHWLMLNFEDNCSLYFQGDNSKPVAFIEVKVFGKITADSAEKMTKTLCDLFQKELAIPKDRIYVKYEEVNFWGWNGANF